MRSPRSCSTRRRPSRPRQLPDAARSSQPRRASRLAGDRSREAQGLARAALSGRAARRRLPSWSAPRPGRSQVRSARERFLGRARSRPPAGSDRAAARRRGARRRGGCRLRWVRAGRRGDRSRPAGFEHSRECSSRRSGSRPAKLPRPAGRRGRRVGRRRREGGGADRHPGPPGRRADRREGRAHRRRAGPGRPRRGGTRARERWRTLLDAAHDHRAAAVVLGSRGRSAFASNVLGSVSRALVHHAPAPVLVVWPPPSSHERQQDGTQADARLPPDPDEDLSLLLGTWHDGEGPESAGGREAPGPARPKRDSRRKGAPGGRRPPRGIAASSTAPC